MAQGCVHSGLDVFQVPGLQTAIEDSEVTEFRSVAALSSDGPVEFVIPGGASYLDLANSYLRVRAKVTLPDGSDVAAAQNVVPANLLLHSMFSDVSVFLGGVQVSSCSGAYPYLAYLQTLLSYSMEPKFAQLQGAFWHHDTAGHFNTFDGNNNKGAKDRRQRTAQSKVVDMCDRLRSDLFHQSRFLLNHVDVRIKLTRSKNPFVLCSSMALADRPDFKLEIVDIGFFARRIGVNPSINLAIEKTLQNATAKYPLTRLVMRIYTAPANSLNFSVDNMFLDRLPNRIVVGFVKATAYNGNFEENPFFFHHCDINQLSLYHEGRQIPSKGFTPDFTSHQYTRSYMSLFTETNTAWSDRSCGIPLDDYAGGNTVWVFDLTHGKSHAPESVTEVSRAGPLRFECRFKKALTEAYNLIVYAEFDGRIEISRSREVLVL